MKKLFERVLQCRFRLLVVFFLKVGNVFRGEFISSFQKIYIFDVQFIDRKTAPNKLLPFLLI